MSNLLRAGTLVLAFTLICISSAMAGPFPEIPGFAKQDGPRTYDPDSLFEYINGDAFSYLNLGFEEVTVQDYANESKQRLTVDIYRHSSDNNGFGIYSHERPADADLLQIGAEGYLGKGLLNFFKGPYYVKLRGDCEESLLKKVAMEVAGALEGSNTLPATAAAFPEVGLSRSSLRYVAEGFMGHSFLNSAFVAEYPQGECKLQVFIIEAADSAASAEILQKYLTLVENKGGARTLDDGTYRFKDPYHSSRGTVNIRQAGNYLIGLFSEDAAATGPFLKQIENKLLY
jgi:hypothetical protein